MEPVAEPKAEGDQHLPSSIRVYTTSSMSVRSGIAPSLGTKASLCAIYRRSLKTVHDSFGTG